MDNNERIKPVLSGDGCLKVIWIYWFKNDIPLGAAMVPKQVFIKYISDLRLMQII